MSPFFLQYEESKSRLELSSLQLRHQAAFSSAAEPVLVFNQRRLSNLSRRVSIWQGSRCEWIVCVCVYWWRGGDYRMQCIVGNVVLAVTPQSCHFAGWLCASCEAFAWFLFFFRLGFACFPCRLPCGSGVNRDPLTAEALRQAVPRWWHWDYKGFMQANKTTSVPPSRISFFKNYRCLNKEGNLT